jgi:hypothetical protein
MARHYRTDDVLDYSGEPTHRLRPPSRLAPRAKAIFIHLVNNTATGHFKASDQGLLERLCETQMIAEIAAEKLASEGAVDADGKVSGWFQVHTVASRTASSLATRLRLTVLARAPRAVKTVAGPTSYYDEMILAEGSGDDDGANGGRS